MRRLGVAAFLVAASFAAGCGHLENAGEVTNKPVPASVVAARAAAESAAAKMLIPDANEPPPKQILFGDLHVHTTFSADAFLRTLPMLAGEGAHPPADACDFARFCSGLDFWSINDHAEAISPNHWQETKDLIRQCNAVNTDAANPDVVAFLGWEWTQVGGTPHDHYGHKNVIFRETEEDKVPTRPITALSPRLVGSMRKPPPFRQRVLMPLMDFSNRQRYWDFGAYVKELADTPICPEGVDVRALPADCTEVAETPDVLFEKLNQWGYDSMVIPHGTTWGLYTPPGTTIAKQLEGNMHDPERQKLFEIYSGHGNSEEFRTWKAIDWDAKGNAVCPAPTKDYEPCCWRAGEIIRKRCGDIPAEECEKRVVDARQKFLAAGVTGRLTVPGTEVPDWMNCGQCTDCFNPSYSLVPGNSAQYALAIGNFDDPVKARHFRFGFIGSSDNHSARPGTGYKDYQRRMMTETTGARDKSWRDRIVPHEEATFESVAVDPNNPGVQAFVALDTERQGSFFMTGGLVAVHSAGRDRNSIWNALQHREVYATSGDRILLWFDLLNGDKGITPMGAEAKVSDKPRFRIRAVGSFKQKPGCPEHSTNTLSPERLEYLCRGECYNPSDERHRIIRLEVVRIRPQTSKNEPIASLIDDPWKRFDCGPDPAGCAVEFDDPEFAGNREVVYYARAIQEPTAAINAGGLRTRHIDCYTALGVAPGASTEDVEAAFQKLSASYPPPTSLEMDDPLFQRSLEIYEAHDLISKRSFDAQGQCIKVNPCYGDYRTPFDDDCLSANEEHAWSSPIYVSGR